MPGTRRSQAAVEDMYHDLRGRIRQHANLFAYKYGQDPAECFGEACLIFMEAVRGSYDSARGGFRDHVNYRVWCGLMDRYRPAFRRYKNTKCVSRKPERLGRTDPRPFELPDWLSDDGRHVVGLLLDTPPALADAIRSDRHPGRASIRAALTAHLTAAGWSPRRVTVAFREIRRALQD